MNILKSIEGFFSPATSSANDLITRDADPGNVLTVVSVVYSTAAKTFSGPAVYVTQAGAPVAPTPASSQATPTHDSSEAQTTQENSAPTSMASADSGSDSAASSTFDDFSSASVVSSTTTSEPSLLLAPSSTQGQPTGVRNAATNSPSPTAAANGMSGGAKAGLAIGLLILFALLGGSLFWFYRRQKAKHDAHQPLDDEKMAMSQPDALPRNPEPQAMSMGALGGSATPRSQEAPRLSIRPMTEFDSSFGANQSSAAPALGATAAAGLAAAAAGKNTGLRKPGVSAWERPGAERNGVNDPSNPFGNHAETVESRPGTAQTDKPLPSPIAVPPPVSSDLRAPSPAMINPADFPLPSSVPPSPNTAMFAQNAPGASKGAEAAAAGVAAGAAVGAAAVERKPAPKSAPAAQGPVHRVQMDFMPSMEDELEIHTGQLLRIKHEYDDGWALCELMDGSKSGVVPRSCLSKAALQARPTNGPRQAIPTRPAGQARGPPPRSPGGIPQPLTPGGGRNSPGPNSPMVPRALTPTGRNSPAAFAQQQRSASQGRPRASSGAAPYVAYQPTGRAMSPGPYGAGGLKPTPRPENQRRRSKSVSQVGDIKPQSPTGSVPRPLMPSRKPVASRTSSGST